MALSLARRMLYTLYQGLIQYGTFYTGPEPYHTMGCPPPGPFFSAASLHGLTGPGAMHPERIRQDIPLTQLERTLMRELRSG